MKNLSFKKALILKIEQLIDKLKQATFQKARIEKEILNIQKQLNELNERILDIDVKSSEKSN